MPSQLKITDVMKAARATRADVLRVASKGGTTEADRRTAVAIEAAGGRRAEVLMDMGWRAEHTRLQEALWLETREEDFDFLAEHAAKVGITDISLLTPAVSETRPEQDTPRPPAAERVREVRIYSEETAPDAPARVAPHHPHDDEPTEDQLDPAERRERHRVRLWAVVAGLIAVCRGTDPEAVKARVNAFVKRLATPEALREGLTYLLRRTAERASERRRARAQYLLDTYVTAA